MLTSCFLRSFFTPKVFTKLLKDDPLGRYEVMSSINISKIHFSIYSFRVSITQLFSYIMRKGTLTTILLSSYITMTVWLQQTRIGLSLFDIQGLGFLRESVSYLL